MKKDTKILKNDIFKGIKSSFLIHFICFRDFTTPLTFSIATLIYENINCNILAFCVRVTVATSHPII